MQREVRFLFGQFLPRCTHRIDKRFDGYHVLQFMDGGAVELSIDGESRRLSGRWFWSSYPGPRIAFHPALPHKTWVHRYLAFAGPAVKRWTRNGLFPIAPQPVPAAADTGDYARRFDEMLALSRRTDRWGAARAAIAMETMLIELAEARQQRTGAASDRRPAPPWLADSLARLQALGPAPDQQHLATEAGMPPRTFRRKFTAAVGMPPSDYAIAARIGHAKEMLGATELPIKTIARQLGYRDVSFFTRQFRLIAGVPPAAYRRSREG